MTIDMNRDERIERIEFSIDESKEEIKQVEFLISEMKKNKDKVRGSVSYIAKRVINDLESEKDYLNSVLEDEERSLEHIRNS